MSRNHVRPARPALSLVIALGAAGCTLYQAEPGSSDPDAAPSRCDPAAPFHEAVPIRSLNSPLHEGGARLSPDELTVYFHRQATVNGAADLFTATRASIDDDFGTPRPIEELATPAHESYPTVSADGRTLYFQRDNNLWRATRASSSATFVTVVPASVTSLPPSATSFQRQPYLTPQALLFVDTQGDAASTSTLAAVSVATDGNLGVARRMDGLDRHDAAVTPVESTDGLRLFWSSWGGDHLWTAQRESVDAAWGEPAEVTELSGRGFSYPTFVSPDGCALYFHRTDGAPSDLWVAHRAP